MEMEGSSDSWIGMFACQQSRTEASTREIALNMVMDKDVLQDNFYLIY